MKEPIKIFFCYARENEALLNKLKAHLSPLQRQGLINVWHDRDISAGAEWEKEISKYLNAAQIIVLMLSPDFMNSDYCYGIEVNRALERDGALAIPKPGVCKKSAAHTGSIGYLSRGCLGWEYDPCSFRSTDPP